MEIIEKETFNIRKVEIRALEPVKAITPFEDATMGPFESMNLSLITITDSEGYTGEAPVLRTYINILENCILPILLHSHHISYGELYPRLYWSIRNEGFRGQASTILGQLDLALFDLASRRKGKPLHTYLGATRNYTRMYGSGCGTNYTYQNLEKEISYFLDNGIDCIKMKVGKDHGRAMQKDIDRLKFIRRLVGDEVRLAADANQVWSVDEALRFLDEAGVYDLGWFEEPVHSASITDIEALCKGTPVPVSYGESERSGKVFPALINAGVRHLQPVPYNLSSIQEWLEVRDKAKNAGIAFTSGGYSLYTSSLMATASEEFRVEYLYTLMSGLEEYFTIHPKLEKGKFILPDIEGLPIRIDWDYWERKNKIVMKKTWTAANVKKYTPGVLL